MAFPFSGVVSPGWLPTGDAISPAWRSRSAPGCLIVFRVFSGDELRRRVAAGALADPTLSGLYTGLPRDAGPGTGPHHEAGRDFAAVRRLLAEAGGPVAYGSKDPKDMIFRDELNQLARAHDTIDVTHVMSEPVPSCYGRSGFITADLIAELAGPHLQRTTYYLCGPTAMYDFCLDALQRLDVARRRIRYEANGPPTEPQRLLPDWPSQLSPATTITVSINGRDKFTAPCGEPLLNSLERAGYQLEVGCRSGHCSLCRVKILSGTVVDGPEGPHPAI